MLVQLPVGVRQCAVYGARFVGGLHHPARSRHLDAGFHWPFSAVLFSHQGLKVGDPVGQVIEAIAFGGDPGHFRAFAQYALIIRVLHHAMLAPERFIQPRQQAVRFGQGAVAGQLQAVEDTQVLGVQRIAAGADYAAYSCLKGWAETTWVQFGDEELGDIFRQILLTIAPAGHVQFGQWIRAHIGKTQRFQQTGECQAPPGQFAVCDPVHRPDSAMVEQHFAPLSGLFLDIQAAHRHSLHQLVKQAQVQRFSQPRAVQRGLAPAEGVQAFRYFDVGFKPLRSGSADDGGDEREKALERGHGQRLWLNERCL